MTIIPRNRVFFFLQPKKKKKGLANPTKGFLRIKKEIRHIWRKNKVKSCQPGQLPFIATLAI
jgi:hypothetical protein